MEKQHRKAISGSISICPIWPTQASEKVGQMLQQIDQSGTLMQNIASTAQNSSIKGGFAAEVWQLVHHSFCNFA